MECEVPSEKLIQFNQVNNAMDFNGKVALITGAGGGIGGETARLFCYLGAKVVINDISADGFNQVANECQNLSPTKLKPLVIVADLTKDDQVQFMMKETIETFGQIDILANVAAIVRHQPFTEHNYLENYREVTEVNVEATIRVIQAAIPYMKLTKGVIINLSSGAFDKPMFGATAYQMGKASIVTLTKSLSRELGPDIRINCISPGVIFGTLMTKNLKEDYESKIRSSTSLGRTGSSFDVAKGIVFLASPLAQWITGQNINIDGGFYGDYSA